MIILNVVEAILEKSFATLQAECQVGSNKAARAMANSGARCAELLAELLQLDDGSPGKVAVENAAKKAQAWLISYPALDDGRPNRIADQIPAGLKVSLKISTRALRATGKPRPERPGVKTFLEEGIDQLDESVGIGIQSILAKGAIMGALIMLRRECAKGDVQAVLIVANAGVKFADFLAEMNGSPRGSVEKLVVTSAARECPEWPVALCYRSNLGLIHRLVPPMLGRGSAIRIKKYPGTKADRFFNIDSRVGFANHFLEELQEGRRLARKYDDGDTANLLEMIERSKIAHSAIGKKGFQIDPKIYSSVHRDTLDELILAQGTLVPCGYEKNWKEWKHLPIFSEKNLERWIVAALNLADAICDGKWDQYPWPSSLISEGKQRQKNTGAKLATGCKAAVKSWINEGFENLLKDARP